MSIKYWPGAKDASKRKPQRTEPGQIPRKPYYDGPDNPSANSHHSGEQIPGRG